ncbi:E3 ubiquitin-protein ligase RNF146 [Podarcis lilfordi]|uniref:E3 ubiquitin-protein ligase n=1 Tax=Podarcis lilfordi TaxID=74358 RepID=A0AA35K4B3_9SAUR|nr:E3 ubiquitin-protein ligase RNF146 [Podarcis lilfordi]
MRRKRKYGHAGLKEQMPAYLAFQGWSCLLCIHVLTIEYKNTPRIHQAQQPASNMINQTYLQDGRERERKADDGRQEEEAGAEWRRQRRCSFGFNRLRRDQAQREGDSREGVVRWHCPCPESSIRVIRRRKRRMAGCGEIDHSINMLPTNKKTNESCSGAAPSLMVPECAICLQTCVHPVSLPCKHVFCYLCVKGASWLGKRCALCRQEIPEDFLDKPTLLSPEELKAASRGNGEYAWYYEGRNGWWQYDERTSRELEDAFSKVYIHCTTWKCHHSSLH